MQINKLEAALGAPGQEETAVDREVGQRVRVAAAILKSDEKGICVGERWRKGNEVRLEDAREFDGGLFATPESDVYVPYLRKGS